MLCGKNFISFFAGQNELPIKIMFALLSIDKKYILAICLQKLFCLGAPCSGLKKKICLLRIDFAVSDYHAYQTDLNVIIREKD